MELVKIEVPARFNTLSKKEDNFWLGRIYAVEWNTTFGLLCICATALILRS